MTDAAKQAPTDPIRLTQAITEYGISRATWDRAVARKELTRFKAGNITFLDRDEIRNWMQPEEA